MPIAMTRRQLSSALLGGCLSAVSGYRARAQHQGYGATLYKDPECDCCSGYGGYLEQNGFRVTIVPTSDLSQINRQRRVPPSLEGCHVTMIERYVVAGHVPIRPISRLLAERPNVIGITLPGMPLGSPGMTGLQTGPFTIFEILNGPLKVYAVE